MSDAKERLRQKAQNEQTCIALNDLLNTKDDALAAKDARIAELEGVLAKALAFTEANTFGGTDALELIEECHTAIAGQQQPGPATHSEDGREVPMTAAARDVLAERRRQVEAEGWTPEHDDAHGRGAMALAAGCYARHAHQSSNWHGRVPESWPWGSSWWKPKTARENLVRAGALIIAEIERIDRAAKLKEQRDD